MLLPKGAQEGTAFSLWWAGGCVGTPGCGCRSAIRRLLGCASTVGDRVLLVLLLGGRGTGAAGAGRIATIVGRCVATLRLQRTADRRGRRRLPLLPAADPGDRLHGRVQRARPRTLGRATGRGEVAGLVSRGAGGCPRCPGSPLDDDPRGVSQRMGR